MNGNIIERPETLKMHVNGVCNWEQHSISERPETFGFPNSSFRTCEWTVRPFADQASNGLSWMVQWRVFCHSCHEDHVGLATGDGLNTHLLTHIGDCALSQ